MSSKAEGPHGLRQAVERLNCLQGIKGEAVAFAIDISNMKGIEELVALWMKENISPWGLKQEYRWSEDSRSYFANARHAPST